MHAARACVIHAWRVGGLVPRVLMFSGYKPFVVKTRAYSTVRTSRCVGMETVIDACFWLCQQYEVGMFGNRRS